MRDPRCKCCRGGCVWDSSRGITQGRGRSRRQFKGENGPPSPRPAKRLWSGDIDPAERFRKQVCFSSFMMSELRKTQRDICTVCGMPLWKRQVVIHHMDYAHQCDWAGTICATVTGKEVEVPDCGDCRRDDARRFDGCRRRLQLLHRGCHADYHAGRSTIKPMM